MNNDRNEGIFCGAHFSSSTLWQMLEVFIFISFGDMKKYGNSKCLGVYL